MIRLRSNVSTLCFSLILVVSCADVVEYDYEYRGDLQFKLLDDTTGGIGFDDSYILTIVTEEIFNSVPNYMVSEIEKSSDEINIHILSIDRSAAMLGALGQAIAVISLQISSENNYSLKFHNGDAIDEYSLSIEADSISVDIVDTSFTKYLRYDEIFGP